MISENAAAENQGPGIFFLIWILLFWEKGESLVSQKKLLLSHSVKNFCMSTRRATTFSASCSWHSNVTMAKETLLLPPGRIPENTGKRAWVCAGEEIILGVRTPWASSPGSPGVGTALWGSLIFPEDSFPSSLSSPIPKEGTACIELSQAAVCCFSCVDWT